MREQEIQKSHAYEQKLHKTHACELKIHRIRKIFVIRQRVMTQSCNQLLRIQLTLTRFVSGVGEEPISTPCEPSECEKMKHELTHSPFKPWCTSCVKGTAQAETHKRIERIIEDSELPSVQCDYLVLKDTAASDGLKVLSMSAKSFGYGTSTVVETKGATDTFAVTWRVKMLNCLGLFKAEGVESKRQERTVMQRDQWTTIKKCRDRCARCWQHFKTARNKDRLLTVHIWIVRHAAWLIPRFKRKRCESPFYRATGGPYRGQLLEFGESVLAHLPEVGNGSGNPAPKLADRWQSAVWLCKSDITDEHLVRTDEGVVYARSVRRPAEHRWSEENLRAIVENPQTPRSTTVDIPPAAEPFAPPPPPAAPEVPVDEKGEPRQNQSKTKKCRESSRTQK